jgi:hypothetical protein
MAILAEMDQNYLDYAEGVPASPDESAAEPAPNAAPVRGDPVFFTAYLLGSVIAISMLLTLERAGVDALGSGWAFLIYAVGCYSVLIPSLLLGRWLSRRLNTRHDNPDRCKKT